MFWVSTKTPTRWCSASLLTILRGDLTMKNYTNSYVQKLASQSQLFGELAVALGIVPLQIVQKPFAFGHHFQKTAARAVVFQMLFQMLGKALNFLGKEGDLNLRRSGVGIMESAGSDDLAFCLGTQHRFY